MTITARRRSCLDSVRKQAPEELLLGYIIGDYGGTGLTSKCMVSDSEPEI